MELKIFMSGVCLDVRSAEIYLEIELAVPCWQHLTLFGRMLNVSEEVINRMAHVNHWQLSRFIGSGTYAAQLEFIALSVEGLLLKKRRHTFSSILFRGPPPPSPLPKTSKAVSLDSRFLWFVIPF